MAASKELTDDVRLAHLMADDADSLSMNRFKARDRNVGWRIDYFFVSEELRPKVKRAWIDANPTATPEQYEAAMKSLAKQFKV